MLTVNFVSVPIPFYAGLNKKIFTSNQKPNNAFCLKGQAKIKKVFISK